MISLRDIANFALDVMTSTAVQVYKRVKREITWEEHPDGALVAELPGKLTAFIQMGTKPGATLAVQEHSTESGEVKTTDGFVKATPTDPASIVWDVVIQQDDLTVACRTNFATLQAAQLYVHDNWT